MKSVVAIVFGNLLLAAACALAALVSSLLAVGDPPRFALWLASGISVAVVVRCGLMWTPGVMLGAWAFNLFTGMGWVFALGGALANGAEAFVAAALIRRWIGPTAVFSSTASVARFLGAAAAGVVASALVGTTGALLSGRLELASAASFGVYWGCANLVAILVIAPVLWGIPPVRAWRRPWRRIHPEAAVTFLAFAGSLGLLVLPLLRGVQAPPPGFVAVLLLLWISVRFPGRPVHWAVLAFALSCLAFVKAGFPGVAVATSVEAIGFYWSFVGCLAIGSLAISALVWERREALQQLETQRTLLREVIDSLDIQVVVKDRDGRYLLVNRAFAKVQGQPVADLEHHLDREMKPWLGDSPPDLPDAEIRQRFNEQMDRFRAEETALLDGETESIEREEPFFQEDGRRGYALVRKHRIALTGAIAEAVLVTITRIDAIKQAEEESRLNETRLRLALEAADIGLWSWDIRADRVEHDPTWLRILGYPAAPENHRMREWYRRLHPEDRGKLRRVVREMVRGTRSGFVLEYRVQTAAGDYIWVSSRELIDLIETSANHLMRIINDILDLSRIDAGRMRLQMRDYSLEVMAREIEAIYRPRMADKTVSLRAELSSELPETIRSDPDRIRQVFFNLVDNACKFTSDGEIVIRVFPGSQAEGPAVPPSLRNDDAGILDALVIVAVADTGIGIPESGWPRLFDAFSQIDESNTRQYGGTGLGLAICKRIIEAHGGSIWVESEEGVGSTFYFSLPVQAGFGKSETTVAEHRPGRAGGE